MKTVTINLYSFDELSKDAQNTAIHNWMQNDDNELPEPEADWADHIKEQAKELGIKITSFNADHYCNGKFINGAEFTSDQIRITYAALTDNPLYLTAMVYEQEKSCLWSKVLEAQLDGEAVENPHPDLPLAQQEFLYSVLEDFRIMLKHEWECLTGTYAIEQELSMEGEVFLEDGEKLGADYLQLEGIFSN